MPDGRIRKYFRLVLLPEEAEIPKLIFDLYLRTDSLTAVEAELLRRRIRTRQGKDYSRFSVRAILQNPVYAVADGEIWDYFTQKGAQLCFPRESFDGSCGIMAYNRTAQEKGKPTVLLPVSEWILAPGQHPGLIPSGQWIRVQASLERNRSSAYRKPRSNEALLTGVLYCACGERMYPKLSQRKISDGTRSFSYVCALRSRSKGTRCSCGNASGNQLDAAVMEQLGVLPGEKGAWITRLTRNRHFLSESKADQTPQLAQLRAEYLDTERLLQGLTDSLALAEGSPARQEILKRMETLTRTGREIRDRIQMLETAPPPETLSADAGGQLCSRLVDFGAVIGGMDLEEKRTAVRSLVRRIIWNGTDARMELFGGEESKTPWRADSK